LYALTVNLGLAEMLLITLVTIGTLAVPALAIYLVFTAGRRRGRSEARRESLADEPEPDRRHP
jgi:hypothetical protein